MMTLGESHITAQSNHDRAGQRSLAATEALRPADALAERSGQQGAR